jgi:hypothetical protein
MICKLLIYRSFLMFCTSKLSFPVACKRRSLRLLAHDIEAIHLEFLLIMYETTLRLSSITDPFAFCGSVSSLPVCRSGFMF